MQTKTIRPTPAGTATASTRLPRAGVGAAVEEPVPPCLAGGTAGLPSHSEKWFGNVFQVQMCTYHMISL